MLGLGIDCCSLFNRSMVKRLLDLGVALALILLLAPLMALTALAVASCMGTPVLFRQKRPGLHGRPFELFKFRTMTNEAGPDGRLLADELRLTPLGFLMRRLSLDELPQLFNVVRGDMSLVGPRPLLMEYLPLYSVEQNRRHEVRPGITGWAQINGRNALPWEARFEMDVWYVDNRSMLQDVKILAMTASRIFRPHGISEPGQVTMTPFRGGSEKAGRVNERKEPDREATLTRDYEANVMAHYSKVAQEAGLSSSCTMEDAYVRHGETRAIHRLIESVAKSTKTPLRVLDVGCGNGFTLRTLADRIREGNLDVSIELIGIEKNLHLRQLAIQMNEGLPVLIQGGDVMRTESLALDKASVDVCISQRVLINLMNAADQKTALDNLVALVRPGGFLLFIECFEDGLENLNAARREFKLEPNNPAVHNLYLRPEFFVDAGIREEAPAGWNIPATLFSTHYYVQRVLQSALRGDVIDRNSHFVSFFSEALPEAVGNYSPIRIHCFRKSPL